MKLLYETKKGEKLYSEEGNRAKNDLRLYIGFKDFKWAHTLELIGAALRAKAHIEDNNYPNGRGKHMLLHFIQECILTKTPIKELLKKFKIPGGQP